MGMQINTTVGSYQCKWQICRFIKRSVNLAYLKRNKGFQPAM